MSSRDQLWDLYNKFYAQRAVLQSAPQLTLDVPSYTVDTFDFQLADKEMNAMVGYLLGVPDASRLKIGDAMKIVSKSYENQPFWKNLILDYLSYRTEKIAEGLREEAVALHRRGQEILKLIRHEEAKRKAVVDAFSAAIEKEHFPVDARRLIQSYLNMRRIDPEKAWEVLITNPGYFSPIITTDSLGRPTLTPEKAIEENKRLARFLKSLKL